MNFVNKSHRFNGREFFGTVESEKLKHRKIRFPTIAFGKKLHIATDTLVKIIVHEPGQKPRGKDQFFVIYNYILVLLQICENPERSQKFSLKISFFLEKLFQATSNKLNKQKVIILKKKKII